MDLARPNRAAPGQTKLWPNTCHAASAMSLPRFIIGLTIFSFLSIGFGSTTNDLASPDQATRDAAAKALRATWTPPARTNWDSLLAALTNGMPRRNVLELLRPLKVTPEGAGGGG